MQLKMIMNFKIVLLGLVLLITNYSIAQEGRLPSKQELDTKLFLEKQYKANVARGINQPGHLMVTGPEQNCNNALPVCAQSYTQSTSYTGNGTIQELSTTCLSSDETNSVWYTFTVQNSGTFTFMLNTANDYDFALYDITTIGCAGVPSATPIRCNYSATYGSTGLTLPAGSSTPNGIGAGGVPTMPGINVTAGQTFALIIDNYSANSNGYTITFGGTAQIFDQTPPAINSINASCTTGSITVMLSEPIRCNSIAANGSDFTITGPGGISIPVTAAAGSCSGGAGFTNQLTITYDNASMPTGTYTLSTQTGVDGNTILDNCGNLMNQGLTQTFSHLGSLTIAAVDPAICAGSSSTLTVTGGTASAIYSWAPQSASDSFIVVSPIVTTNYNVTVTYGNCTSSATQAVTIANPPVATINPSNVSICSGTTTISASATLNGSVCTNCNFTWSGGSTQVDNNTASSVLSNVGPGTYSVSVSTANGCVGNTAASTVTLLSPSNLPSCNILYVSPTGGGTGLTKASPTTIQNALSLAACNSVTIKMQIGDYNITAPLTVGSYVTIEGGYDLGFTKKTSGKAIAGGFPLQGTRIVRTAVGPESAVAGESHYTGISITPGSSYFRLQDIMVSMPDNAAGTGISNYGIYVGGGCSEYYITRCSVYSGNAGSGISGSTPASTALSGSPGSPGFFGDNGDGGDAGNFRGSSGAGGNGAGANGGVGAAFVFFPTTGTVGLNGTTGGSSTNPRDGGAGGSGGTGGFEWEGGNGGNGGNRSGGAGADGTGATTGGAFGDWGGCDAQDGFNGNNGNPGGIGTPGTVGGAGSDVVGYWIPGSQGGVGSPGFGGGGGKGGGGGGGTDDLFCNNGTGAGGGGGGGGGQGGDGGTGGFGGGSTYGIFIFNNGANGHIVDCEIVNGLAGAGGAGGAGAAGGSGGTGGAGGCADNCNGQGEGDGGRGGDGGQGGQGGTGGTGSTGQAIAIQLIGGTPLVDNITLALSGQAVITSDNIACINSDIDFTANSGSPNWTNFGSNSNPTTGGGSPFNDVEYTATGLQTVVLNSDVTNMVLTTLTGAAQTVSNTATSPALSATGNCPTPTNNNIVVSGYPASTAMNAANISVRISAASHGWRSDVSMFLIAPSGQIIGLVENKGPDGACTLTNINFSDAGAGAMGLTCPAAGSTFRPEAATFTACGTTSTITSFGALGAAMNPNGTWTLRQTDEFDLDGGSGIAVGGWSISFPTYSYTDLVSTTVNQNDTYTDFLNIQTTQPGAGDILASANQICPGTALFGSTTAGTPGFTYNWSVTPSTGVTIIDSDTSSTGINFPNTTTSPITYTVTLQVATECCGNLIPIDTVITVNPIPADPTVANQITCTGGSTVLTVTAPIGESFDWYANSTGGASINTGTTYSVNPVNGPQTYYVQSVNSGGCSSNRIPVTISDTLIDPPTAMNVMQCDTGIVQVGATAVTGANTYNWYSDAAGTNLLQSGPSLSYGVNISALGGTVTVYVSDSVPGCNESVLIPVIASVSNNPILTDTIYSPNDTVCAGTNVTITVNPTGGNGAYTYTWGPNGGAGNSLNITPATNSTAYSVIIDDGTCAIMVPTPLIVGSTGLPPTITGLNAVCEGDSIILVTPEVSGATYSWNGPGGSAISTNDTLIISSSTIVHSGNYTVFVDEGIMCPNPSTAFNVTVNALPVVTVNSTTAICAGATLSVTANNADTYTWSAGATSTGVNTADVSPGIPTTYTVTGTVAATGCSDTTAFTVNVNALPTPTVADQSVCLGNAATLTIGNVVADETYSWSTTATGTSISVTPTSVGTETVSVVATNTVTNCASLPVTATVTATAPPNITASTATPSICLGESATLTASNGSTYVWSSGGGNATETVTPGLGTTQYTVTGTISGCSNTATVDVTVNAIPAFTVNNATICNGSTASLTASDNTLTYSWQAGVTSTGGNTATANPTTQTSYTVIGTNSATTCSVTVTFTVDVNALPTPIVADQSVCLGNTATLTIGNVVADETYAWSTSATGTTISITPTVAGTETVSVVATNTVTNCASLPVTASVTATALPIVTATAVPAAICSGSTSTLTGGGATSYSWSGGVTDGVAFTPAGTATYTVTGTTGACSNTTTVTITVNQSPQVAANVTNATCNTNNGAVDATISSGTPNFTYNWVSLPGSTSVGTTEDLSGLAIGAYQLTVTDANSCTFTSAIYTVAGGPSVTADFTTDVVSGVTPLVVTIDNNTTGANTYSWNFGNGQTSVTQNPGQVTYTSSGTYTITLVASNGTCTETATVVITTEVPSTIIVPNIFSPNGDNLNDQFTIYSTGLKTLSVDIFNRWGQKVALIEGVGQSWDGKLTNGDKASEGTYFYMLKAVGLDGKEHSKEGAMMLVE